MKLAALPLLLLTASCGLPAGDLPDQVRPESTLGYNTTMQLASDKARRAAVMRAFRAAAPDRVLFDFDAVTLDATAQNALARQAAFIRAYPQLRFTIVGHADRVGSSTYNYRLGLRRARAVLAALAAHGVPAQQLLAISSRGESAPVIPGNGPERRNRRAVTRLSLPSDRAHLDGHDGKRLLRVYRDHITGNAPLSGAASTQTTQSSR